MLFSCTWSLTPQKVSTSGNFCVTFPYFVVSFSRCINIFHFFTFVLAFSSFCRKLCLPLLFTLYASKLFEVIKHHLPSAHAYADDTQLNVSFKPDCSASEAECFSAMEKCIRAVRAWMIQDKMKLNDDKTEFLIIGTSQQLKKVRTDTLSVGDAVISPVLSARNLPYQTICISKLILKYLKCIFSI